MKNLLNNMFEKEAELGSDNEENDHVVKKIDSDSEQGDEDLDKELEELINNQVDLIEEDEERAI